MFFIRINDIDAKFLLALNEPIIIIKDEYHLIGTRPIELTANKDLYVTQTKGVCVEIKGYDCIDDCYMGKVIKFRFRKDKDENSNG